MNCIEILSIELLDHQHELVESFRNLATRLGIDLGWHYLLDLAWIASQLGDPKDMRILDAGAGTGVLQWWLAERGAHVVSVDRASRRDLSIRYRLGYRVDGFGQDDYAGLGTLARQRLQEAGLPATQRLAGAARAAIGSALVPLWPKAPGRVTLYHHDLAHLEAIPKQSLDAVVAISALEHNPPEQLARIVEELLRVLKADAPLLATLAAARDQDWYHQPSSGWCYTESTLRRVFQLEDGCPSNFDRYDEYFERLRNCDTLRKHLAPYYFRSGDNGMPWGVWDPQYQPVGILKQKPYPGEGHAK